MHPVFVLAYVVRKSNPRSVLKSGLFSWFSILSVVGNSLEGISRRVSIQSKHLHRELMEETGGSGRLLAWNKSYYPNGWVGLVSVDDEEVPFSQQHWNVNDQHVSTVQWFAELPDLPIGMFRKLSI